MSIYDQLKPPQEGDYPDWFKFVNPGDSIEGAITDQRIAAPKVVGDDPYPVLQIQRPDGTEASVACGTNSLYRQLYEIRPANGDTVRITFTGRSGDAKLFQVDHARGNGQTPQPVAAAEPFPAAQPQQFQQAAQPVVSGQGFAPIAAPAQPWAQPAAPAAAPPWQPQG